MAVKLQDVAEKAGVSVTTVSRMLNNRGYISRETREKILAVIQELDYSPNQLARSLYSARTQTIGFVVPSICHPFFSQITQLVENRLYHAGYHVMLCTTESNPGQESQIFNILRQHRVDGIIIGSPNLSEQEYAKVDIPLVAFDTHMIGARVSIAANHALGGRMAAAALLQGGCRRALQIVGDPGAKTDAPLRHQTFMETMLAAGCECISLPDMEDYPNLLSYRAKAERAFDQYPNIDAYFATDLNAAAIMDCAVRRGLSIPGDIQVIGYDGTDMAAIMCPQMTVIRQPFEELAQEIVDSLLRLLKGEETAPSVILNSLTLVQGTTTRT